MHYPFADGAGVGPSRGCLRLIPFSHLWSREEDEAFTADLEARRAAAGLPTAYADVVKHRDQRGGMAVEPLVPGEVAIELGPADLIVRWSSSS